ncbi:TonB-dependent receptor domain-containing protein [Novosphingobium rhizovicinum]|uniref:TonB-dependent receptor n=1 Tax=Novosphingobium rhizovicinum TaxID=3228928 RepID=A0ABV3REG7_9SPHN
MIGKVSQRTRLQVGTAVGGIAASLLMPWMSSTAAAQVVSESDRRDAQTQVLEQQSVGSAANVSSERPVDSDIVVTGTLLRGSAPVGSNVIALGQQAIVSTGAATSNELLATIPQVTNYFNRVPAADLAIAVNQIQVSRPNIRNISPRNASSSGTLILVDGHRIASSGVRQASIDPDAIPTGAIERVEVATEGGSATYGADAVAGVINFITRRRFDGLRVDARYGFADDYWQTDASVTAGKDRGTGSAYVSYTFTKNDPLFGRDRDFIRGVSYASEPYVPLGRTCDQPNLSINTVFVPANFTLSSVNYAGPNFAPNTVNACDTVRDRTVVPAAERHGVIAGLFQNLDDTTTLDVRAFYSRRETTSTSTFDGTVNMAPSNPYYFVPPGVMPIPGGGVIAQRQAVSFSFAPAVGRGTQHPSTLTEVWGFNAELRKELNDDWQLRGLFNYSASNSAFSSPGVSIPRLNAAGRSSDPATAINPYNIAATNSALIADLLDNEIAGQARDDLLNMRAIAEGRLFTLPGGDVRMAAGYEYMRDEFKQRYQSDIRIGALSTFPFNTYDRDVHSVFGEVQVPLFGAENALSWLRSLVLSASGRYDRYSDFGDTFNPKFGATLKPVDWLSLRGNWGTSFTAPTPLDQLGSQQNQISSFAFVAFNRPGEAAPPGSYTVALQGSRPELQPQEAETWSVGFDADPPFLPGLHASVSYYNVTFKDILATPSPNSTIFTNFPDNITTNVNGLSPAELRAFAALAPNGAAGIEPLIASGTRVYQAVDFRTANFGVLKVSGVDFTASYRQQTGFGSFDLGVNGNYQLTRKERISPDAPEVDVLRTENPKLSLQTIAGVDVGPARFQATWNHSSGYDIDPTTSVPVQDRVGAFNTVDLFLKYDVPGESKLLRDLSLSLNVRNVFNEDPPILRRNNPEENGYANGFTLGRLFILGVSKQF